MPRPRFERLDPERRQAILAAAAEIFAEDGFENASYNRIIERTGLSKGAMYYYFDDKEDLYLTVLRETLFRWILETGDVGAARDGAGFWREFEDWYRRCLGVFQSNPTAIGLSRGLAKLMARGSSQAIIGELRRQGGALLTRVVRAGQALGAIRTDLPEGLLVTVIVALEEGIDLWLAEQIGALSAGEIDRLSGQLTDIFRRVAAPGPVGGDKEAGS